MSEEDYELIDKNLAGTASASDQELLSRKLADPVFRKDYEQFAEVQKAIRIHERSRLKKLLADEESGSSKTRTIPLWPWAIAASVSIILAVSYFVFRSSDGVIGEYYATYTELKIDKPRGAADDYRLKVSAYEAYRNEQTVRALNTIDTLLVGSPDDEEALFIRGLIYLQWERYPSAREDFERVKNVDNVQWFLALAYLGEKDIAGGKSVLEEIAKVEESPFRENALKLLKELE
jgi:tetratricopeptide (TPR) repeat protein